MADCLESMRVLSMAFWKVNQNEQVTEDPMENEKGDKSAAAMDCYSTKEDHWVLTMDCYSRKGAHWVLTMD